MTETTNKGISSQTGTQNSTASAANNLTVFLDGLDAPPAGVTSITLDEQDFMFV